MSDCLHFCGLTHFIVDSYQYTCFYSTDYNKVWNMWKQILMITDCFGRTYLSVLSPIVISSKYMRQLFILLTIQIADIHEEKFIREWWSYDCMTQDQLVRITLVASCCITACWVLWCVLTQDNMSSLSNKACKDVYIRHWRWKTDQIDYLGRDKFENLQKKMDVALSEAAPSNTKVRTIMKKTSLKSVL